jgi:hypothetical protein
LGAAKLLSETARNSARAVKALNIDLEFFIGNIFNVK